MSKKFKIKTYNKIAQEGLKHLDSNFFEIGENIEDPDAIILRSYKLSESDIPNTVKAIGRAGAGVNNIPLNYCQNNGVAVFNAPGANSNAVKELVICGLLLSSRGIISGVNKINALNTIDHKEVEKMKSEFKGSELMGKKLGVIGLGAIGIGLANSAENLGMTVFGYDPFISVNAAWNLSSSVKKATSLKELLSQVDYLSLHVPLNDNTRDFISSNELSMMNKNCVLLNFSRSEIVNNHAVLEALNTNTLRKYVTDFPDSIFLNHPSVIAMPHLGASTQEAETNCAVMVAKQLGSFLLEGNVVNSVNFPHCTNNFSTEYRVVINHKNIPQMVQSISALFGYENINIIEMLNKSKDSIAYTMIDVNHDPQSICKKLEDISGILSFRVIKKDIS